MRGIDDAGPDVLGQLVRRHSTHHWIPALAYGLPITVLQYFGHTLGSLIEVLLLWAIGRRRLLEGVDPPRSLGRETARSATVNAAPWLLTLCGTVGGLAWRTGDYIDVIQRVAVATVAASLVVGHVERSTVNRP